MVLLERGGRRATAPFGALVYQPANNIYAHPGDTIYVYSEPQTFLAFGAFCESAYWEAIANPFDAWRISLAEAVAKAAGLNDEQADPAARISLSGRDCGKWQSGSELTAPNFLDRSFQLSTI